jgi:hypothetical protein
MAWRNASADWKRSSGFFRSARRRIADSSVDIWGFAAVGDGGWLFGMGLHDGERSVTFKRLFSDHEFM